jgi:hypothetical protein
VEFPSAADEFTLTLMRAGKYFSLSALTGRCEEALVSSVNKSNCVRYYSTADEIDAEGLRDLATFLYLTADSNHRELTGTPLEWAMKMKDRDAEGKSSRRGTPLPRGSWP